ncbi:sensor histidine kinase [Zhihengliuella alba]|uniref:Sensor-like histidine kinase SenX3 n=1 Tax=Zhihengliuella alba TaxID=547018 RepID=A0ABP7DY79_9MICC
MPSAPIAGSAARAGQRRGPARGPLRARLAAMQVAIVIGLMVLVACVVMVFEDQRIQERAYERARTVALEIADEPDVVSALNTEHDVEVIAPLARLAQETSGVDYVVVVGLDGLRVAHPDPERIGEPVSTDHSLVLQGESFKGVERGTIGVTLRVKEPVYDGDTVVGTVSVGTLQHKVRGELAGVVLGFAPWVLGASAVGTVLSLWAARSIRRRIYGVEPEEVAGLLQSSNALFYSVRDGVVGVDPDGRITLFNREAARLLGLGEPDDGELAALAGRPAADVLDPQLVDLLDLPAESQETRLVLVGERMLLAARRAATLADGRTAGQTLTLQDRTELEATLRELHGQRGLTDALRSQTHEFANRLHVLSGYLSVGAHEAALEYIQRIAGPADRSAVVVSDPGLAGVLAAQAAVARERGVGFAVAPESVTRDPFEADDDVLTVAGNLLSNAIDAAGDGGDVRVLVRGAGESFLISVEDSGPGIAPEDVARVFQRGVTTKPSEDRAGRGVGLALVDRIIERRAGSIEVDRSELGGARLTARWGPDARGGGIGSDRPGEPTRREGERR